MITTHIALNSEEREIALDALTAYIKSAPGAGKNADALQLDQLRRERDIAAQLADRIRSQP